MRRQQPQRLRSCQVWRNIQVTFLCKGCHFLVASVFCIVAHSPLDELRCEVGCQKTFVLKAADARAAVNLAVFSVLSDHFPVTGEEKECVFVQYVHLPPAVYLLWMWAIAAHYGDNYLSYNLSYYCKTRPRTVRTYIMERQKHGERKLHLSQMKECVCVRLRETTCASFFP